MRKNTLFVLAAALFFALGMMAQTSGAYGSQSGTTSQQPGMGTAPQSDTSGSQAGASSQMGSSGSAASKTIDGCIVRTATDYYIFPASGQPEHISSSGQDVSAHVGHHVKVEGTEQPSTSASTSGTSGGTSGTAGGASASNPAGSSTGTSSMSGNASGTGSSAAAGGQDFTVARVSMVSTNCPTSITSQAQAAGMSTSPNK